jgi:putative copper resistance protein D
MDIALVSWRAIHLAATIAAGGVLLFRWLVFDPAEERGGDSRLRFLDRQMKRVFWVSLALSFVSGAAWLLAVSAMIDERSWREALTDGTASTVLTETQFGQAWSIRAVVGLMLGTSVAYGTKQRAVQVLLAMVFVVGLAFGGHGASSPGLKGDAHLVADALHLLAVSAWLGGLVSLGLYMRSIGRRETADLREAGDVARRFSSLGIVSVLTIIGSGIVNTLVLVGSIELLASTEYGHLLIIKIVLFLVMVGIAMFNRRCLLPAVTTTAVSTLQRNSFIEVAFGLAIVCIVAALGTLPPPFGHA